MNIIFNSGSYIPRTFTLPEYRTSVINIKQLF